VCKDREDTKPAFGIVSNHQPVSVETYLHIFSAPAFRDFAQIPVIVSTLGWKTILRERIYPSTFDFLKHALPPLCYDNIR
jgi:hypothetical protein